MAYLSMALKINLIQEELFDLTIFSSIQRDFWKRFSGFFFLYSHWVIGSTMSFTVAALSDTKCAGHRLYLWSDLSQGTQALELCFPSRFSITFRAVSRVDWYSQNRPWSVFMMAVYQENFQAERDHSSGNMVTLLSDHWNCLSSLWSFLP